MAHVGAAAAAGGNGEAFWTACPHCCHVHLYPRPYLGLRLRCPVPACRRAFRASELPAAPPVVPGADMYFCTWAFFPLGPPATTDAWVPFAPFHPFSPPPSPSPSPAPAPNPAAASTDTPTRPTSRRKVGVCLKGRARAEAEEEEEATAAAVNLEAGAAGLGERDGTGIDIDIDINETVDLSDLGFRVDDMGVLHDLP
ncbi:hypothetical protein SEVIR_9G251700v4 [Setaria viridis]|uniref:Uncharacterized protein n=2 Tax=Setaria TaxID=4554 RepID=A0A368SKB4_SETIT|nr:atherin-like [Setaria italica]XP_034576446.1 atherin-like [Setaria viridis]RCV42857.1 hypothetical protein SETIT_9G249100v2 [Setaria italica]TKV93786.1 hypothetical protein SEVIR_9G251700v2 [Setaria viridis]